jgi:hypothetical protein
MSSVISGGVKPESGKQRARLRGAYVSEQTQDLFPAEALPVDPARTRDLATGRPVVGSERHLRAARRLSRQMWRLPDRSEAQTQAGRKICHHLKAMLVESGYTPRQL